MSLVYASAGCHQTISVRDRGTGDDEAPAEAPRLDPAGHELTGGDREGIPADAVTALGLSGGRHYTRLATTRLPPDDMARRAWHGRPRPRPSHVSPGRRASRGRVARDPRSPCSRASREAPPDGSQHLADDEGFEQADHGRSSLALMSRLRLTRASCRPRSCRPHGGSAPALLGAPGRRDRRSRSPSSRAGRSDPDAS
jgi:hypothetical protein